MNKQIDNIQVLEMLSLIYEDLDIDTVERRFVELTNEIFSFDRLALFFVKHHKSVLQGKLSKGFDDGEIEALNIPISEEYVFTTPLITGVPYWNTTATDDTYVKILSLSNFALIPVVNKKRLPCWEITQCQELDCSAYGKKWLRCWLVADTKCSAGHESNSCEKQKKCMECPIYLEQNVDSVEGVLLVDNSISGNPISDEVVLTLAVIGHTVGVAIDNSKRFERTLRVAIKDDLTGLHNRRYFNERLLDELERVKRYPDEPVSLIIVDIDFFKQVNDNFGHQRGDSILVWFGQLLEQKLRKSDVVARYGGEEFAILLINTDKSKAKEVAEELRKSIDVTSKLETGGIPITASFGVATFNEDAHSFKKFIAEADKALYAAKAQGRNKVCSCSSCS